MKGRTYLLGAALLALNPLTYASKFDNFNMGIGFSLGSRMVTIGDSTAAAGTAQNLLGNRKKTTSATPVGTTTHLAHSTKNAALNAHLQFQLNDHMGFKFSADVFMPKTGTHTIYDGQSTTATIALKTTTLVATVSANETADDIDVTQRATVGVSTITAGKRECTVEHSSAKGLSIKYVFGMDSKFAVGFGTLRTSDTYKYTVQEPPAGGTATGVYSDTVADNFQIGNTIADDVDATNFTTEYITNGGTEFTKNFTAVLGATEQYDETINWMGVVGDTEANITKNVRAYAGFGYYWKQLPVSKDHTVAAPMIVKASDAVLSEGHIGIAFKRGEN